MCAHRYKSKKSKLVKKMSDLKEEVQSQKDNAGRWRESIRCAEKELDEKMEEVSRMTLGMQTLREEKATLVGSLESTTDQLEQTTSQLQQLQHDFDMLTQQEKAVSTSFNQLSDDSNRNAIKMTEMTQENDHLRSELEALRDLFAREQKSKAQLKAKHDSLLKRYADMKEHSPMLENIPLTKKNKSALKLQKAKFEKEMGELATEMPHLFSGRVISKVKLEAS